MSNNLLSMNSEEPFVVSSVLLRIALYLSDISCRWRGESLSSHRERHKTRTELTRHKVYFMWALILFTSEKSLPSNYLLRLWVFKMNTSAMPECWKKLSNLSSEDLLVSFLESIKDNTSHEFPWFSITLLQGLFSIRAQALLVISVSP